MKGIQKTHNLSTNLFSGLLMLSITPMLISYFPKVAMAIPQNPAPVKVQTITRPTLAIGSQGERVSELQATLKLLGFYTGVVDGNYNETTARAVLQFKKSAGLNPDGIVDAPTWQKLFPTESIVKPTNGSSTRVTTQSSQTSRQTRIPKNPNSTIRTQTTYRPKQDPSIQYTSQGWPILRLGMQGDEVVKLQTQLQKLGFLKGGIDGDFGVTTHAAVKAAQTRYGLEPDGVVGGSTWEVLLRKSSPKR